MVQAFARRTAAFAVLVAVASPLPVGAAVKGDPGKKMICKIERSSTSRIATSRRCQTAAEWEADNKRRGDMAADRENMLLRNPQDSSGSLGLTAEERRTPN